MKIPYRLRQLSKVPNEFQFQQVVVQLISHIPLHVVVYLTLYWEGVPLEILENVANQNT